MEESFQISLKMVKYWYQSMAISYLCVPKYSEQTLQKLYKKICSQALNKSDSILKRGASSLPKDKREETT